MVKSSNSVFWGVFTLVIACSLTIFGWYACSVNSQAEYANYPPLKELPKATDDGIDPDKAATCVWPYAGLRKEAGNHEYAKDGEKNYIIPIVYGERVEMLGESIEKEKEGRTYMKVRLKDGEVGWVHEYLFEQYAVLAAITNEAELYRRPDPMTLREDKFEVGEIVVVIEDSMSLVHQDWLHVSNRKKEKKGWIKRANVLSFQDNDVQLALRYYIAKQAKELDLKKEKLEMILADETFKESQLISLVRLELQSTLAQLPDSDTEESVPSLPPSTDSNKLFITEESAPVYSTPASDQDEMITQLKEGDVCVVLEVGDREVIDGNNDYWYKVQHQESEGWIYGFYTSMRTLD